MWRLLLASISILAVLPTFPALAQGVVTFEENIVVTAAAEAESEDEAMAAVTVIPRRAIQDSGTASAAELLRLVPGTLLLRSGLDNGVTSLFTRGTNSNHTLVLFDGVRLNSPYFGGYDWSTPLTAGLERIEVVRGPYSALYGGDAIGGVVQLFPLARRGDSFRLFLEGGTSQWRRGEAEVSYALGEVELSASAARRDGSGPLAHDDFSSRSGSVEARLHLGSSTTARVVARQTATHTDVPFSGATVTPNRFTETEESLFEAPIQVELANGERLETSLSWVERQLVFRDPDEPFGFTWSDTRARTGTVRSAWHRSLGGHRLTAGGEWRRDRVSDESVFGVSLDREQVTSAAAFLQDRFELGSAWRVQVGVRWDRAHPWGSEVSPRVTVARHVGRSRLWLSYGRGFRAPSLGELYYPYAGNPNLEAERSTCGELGASLAVAGSGTVQLALFRNRVTNLIDFDYARSRYENISGAAQDGAELAWAVRREGLGSLDLQVSYVDARTKAGETLLRRPRWSAAATLHRPLPAQLEAQVGLVWVGERTDLDPVTFARTDMPSFFTANLALSRPLLRQLWARLRADNLFDRAYQEVRGYPAPGRRLFLGLETVVE